MKISKILSTAALCAVCCLGVRQASAQKVYVEGGLIVLDCGPGSGFPQGAVETLKGKKRITNPSNSALGANNDHNGTINKTVYQKLEIAPTDELPPTVEWTVAYNKCTSKGGADWRLPTQRELQMIWTMHEKLKTLSGFTAFAVNGYYWSATESRTSNSWSVYFASGYTYDYAKLSNIRVRCVREM